MGGKGKNMSGKGKNMGGKGKNMSGKGKNIRVEMPEPQADGKWLTSETTNLSFSAQNVVANPPACFRAMCQ